MSKLKLSELVKQMMEQPEVAPEPTIKPSEPGTKPRRPNPLLKDPQKRLLNRLLRANRALLMTLLLSFLS